MRAIVVDSGVRIEPFGDLVRDLPIGGVRLADRQEALFRRFGLEVTRVASAAEVPREGPRIVTFDNVFFSRRVLKSFLARFKESGLPAARLGLPAESTFARKFSALGAFERQGAQVVVDLWGLQEGADFQDHRAAPPLEVIYKERVVELPVPPMITGAPRWVHPVTSSVAMNLRHWVHVLQASLLSVQIRWVDEVIAHPWWGLSLLARAALGRGHFRWRLAGVANRIGKGVDIHPTARVEGSFIGDGVSIGPQALVRGAIIGAGSVLEQRVDVSYAVLGEKCFVSKHSLVWSVVAFDRAELCMKGMQMCLVGTGAGLTARATPLDVSPGRAIKVKDGDRFVEVDLPVLGACFGHGSFIGADVYTGPGRQIPNGTKVLPDPERVLLRIPSDLDPERSYAVRGGTLVPIDGGP